MSEETKIDQSVHLVLRVKVSHHNPSTVMRGRAGLVKTRNAFKHVTPAEWQHYRDPSTGGTASEVRFDFDTSKEGWFHDALSVLKLAEDSRQVMTVLNLEDVNQFLDSLESEEDVSRPDADLADQIADSIGRLAAAWSRYHALNRTRHAAPHRAKRANEVSKAREDLVGLISPLIETISGVAATGDATKLDETDFWNRPVSSMAIRDGDPADGHSYQVKGLSFDTLFRGYGAVQGKDGEWMVTKDGARIGDVHTVTAGQPEFVSLPGANGAGGAASHRSLEGAIAAVIAHATLRS